MLHLSLAGNILRALGGEFKLYDIEHMPVYNDQSTLLYDQVELSMERAAKHLLGTFVKVRLQRAGPVCSPADEEYTAGRGTLDSAPGY